MKLVFSRAFTTSFPLLLGLLAARELGPIGRGLIALGIGLSVIGAAVAGMGRAHAARTFLLNGGNLNSIGEFIKQSLRTIALFGSILGTTCAGIGYLVTSNQQLLSRGFLVGLLATVPFAACHQFLVSMLVGMQQVRRVIWAEIAPFLVAIPTFIMTILLGTASASTYMLATAAGYGTAAIGTWWIGFRRQLGNAHASALGDSGFRSVWMYDVLDITSTRNDRLISALVMTAGDAGIYAVAGTFVIMWRFIPQSIALTQTHTRIYKDRSGQSISGFLGHSPLRGLAILAVCLTVTASFAPLYLPILVGEDFLGAVQPLALLALAEFALAIYVLISYRLIHSHAGRRIAWVPLIASVGLPIAMFIGYHWSGLSGSALGVAVTYAMMALCQTGVLLHERQT